LSSNTLGRDRLTLTIPTYLFSVLHVIYEMTCGIVSTLKEYIIRLIIMKDYNNDRHRFVFSTNQKIRKVGNLEFEKTYN